MAPGQGDPLPHVTVCICTFRRAALLERVLQAVASQESNNLFSYDIVVSDNDAGRTAEPVVQAFAAGAPVPVTYCVEPRMNIALARNAALAKATGDFAAFIDDDEFPGSNWLTSLIQTQKQYGADAVLGPVVPRFELDPPAWLTKGRFFERPTYPTGHRIAWTQARTGNVLFSRDSIAELDPPFRPEFATAGEDVDFFRRLAENGRRFVWCSDAAVWEVVPPSRCTRRYLLRRAALRGSNFPKHPTRRLRNAVKSLIALPCYTLALPLFALLGHHVLIAYLIRICDHGSRLLAYVGLPLVTERQT